VGTRPRIDLDGVTLVAEGGDGSALALLRRRTREGLVVQVPESAEVLLVWSDVEHAEVDLAAGRVRIQLSDALVERSAWLRGAQRLTGTWVDRLEL